MDHRANAFASTPIGQDSPESASPLGSEFKRGPTGNLRADYDGFFVSFVDSAPILPSFFGPDDDDEGETALCIEDRYYILNGDWRLAYSELAPQGFDRCLEFFKLKAPQFASSWSDQP